MYTIDVKTRQTFDDNRKVDLIGEGVLSRKIFNLLQNNLLINTSPLISTKQSIFCNLFWKNLSYMYINIISV